MDIILIPYADNGSDFWGKGEYLYAINEVIKVNVYPLKLCSMLRIERVGM